MPCRCPVCRHELERAAPEGGASIVVVHRMAPQGDFAQREARREFEQDSAICVVQ